jgi:predicted GNAT family acetyltransferase
MRASPLCSSESPIGDGMTNPVIDNPARSRYELALDGGVAFVDYRQAGNVRELTHSEVPPALRGRGIGAELVAGALQLAREQGLRVKPRCSYVAQFIERNPQFQDVLQQP